MRPEIQALPDVQSDALGSNQAGLDDMDVQADPDGLGPTLDLVPASTTRDHATKELKEGHETLGGSLRRATESRDKYAKKNKKKKAEQAGAVASLHRRQADSTRDELLGDGPLTAALQAVRWHPDPTRLDVTSRFPDGPLFDGLELTVIRQLSRDPRGARWLSAAGMFTVDQARKYVLDQKFHDWLLLEPANKLLMATIAWNERLKTDPPTPAYTLGRHMVLNTGDLEEDQKEQTESERDEDIRNAFVRTMQTSPLDASAQAAVEGGAINKPDVGKVGAIKHMAGMHTGKQTDVQKVENQNAQAASILQRVFLVLQAGLKIYDKEQREHVDFTGGDVARAMAHGGRVNIRIPAITGDETGHELTDWLGITENGKGAGGAVFSRGFGTHHMKIKKNKDGERGEFIEEGGTAAAARNAKPGSGAKTYGMNVSAGGMGNLDYNGDVILPDGGHGHMFIGFTAPTKKKDGALQVGMETTAPGAPSMVGYAHTAKSTEATANPESSFYGHKTDKIGDGSPRGLKFGKTGTKGKDYESWQSTNARFVELSDMNGGDWLTYLERLRTQWFEPLKAQDEQGALEQLVGPRQFGVGADPV